MSGKALVGETKCCAHRGACATHPENTVPAFREAARLGADMIEFDVGMTKDGRDAILHDPTVDRTTNGKGALADLTFEQVRQLDAGSHKGSPFAGEKIPTVDEALAAIPPGIVLNVHMKSHPGVVDATIDALRRADRIADAVLAATQDQISRVRELCPEVRICCMTRQGHGSYLDLCIELGVSFLQYLHGQVTAASVKAAHDQGITVNCFFANDEREMRRQIDCGVDYILTDDAARLLGVLGRGE